MKHTLLLTHEYYPYKGGIANYCYSLFKFFDKKDYLVITDNTEVSTRDNIINLKLKNRFLKPSYILSYFKLKKIIKDNNIEQIFTPNILPLGSLAYFLNIPYIISLHGLDIKLALENKPKLTKKILKKAKKIIVNSKHTAEIIKDLNLDDKIELIYPSIDIKKECDENKLEELKNKLDIKDNLVLLTVGRLNKRKSHDLVIKVVKDLKDKLNIKYYIIGRGEELDNLKTLIKKYNLENNVCILTDIEDNDLVYYYNLADIFVLPQRYSDKDIEGFGIVFLEAGSYGLPIIAGNKGGPTEILSNKNSVLINQDNLEELKSSILSLNKDKRKELSENIKKRVKDFPSTKDQSNKLKQIL